MLQFRQMSQKFFSNKTKNTQSARNQSADKNSYGKFAEERQELGKRGRSRDYLILNKLNLKRMKT
jgi:hypothetical protein